MHRPCTKIRRVWPKRVKRQHIAFETRFSWHRQTVIAVWVDLEGWEEKYLTEVFIYSNTL